MQSEIETPVTADKGRGRILRALGSLARPRRFGAPWLRALEIFLWAAFFAFATAFLALFFSQVFIFHLHFCLFIEDLFLVLEIIVTITKYFRGILQLIHRWTGSNSSRTPLRT